MRVQALEHLKNLRVQTAVFLVKFTLKFKLFSPHGRTWKKYQITIGTYGVLYNCTIITQTVRMESTNS